MENKNCFVIMPFSQTTDKHTENYWTNFFLVIKREIEEFGYSCSRSEVGPYNILKQIVEKINESDLVIAVLTDLNPNVWYELGIRHSLKNGTIMLIEDLQKVPFDISSYGLVKYSDDITLATRLHNEFGIYLKKLNIAGHYDSPVIENIGIPLKFQQKFDFLYDLVLKISKEKSVLPYNEEIAIPLTRHNSILWVDDYPSNNAQVIELFQDRIHFDIAISTVQGIKLLADNQYDLIITDMGRGNEPDAGLQLINQIKKKYPACKTPIIVFASVQAIRKYGNQAKESGAKVTINGLSEIINFISKTILSD